MSQTIKNTLKSYCFYIALRPSYSPTRGWGSTSSSPPAGAFLTLLTLGRSTVSRWRKNSPPLLPSWIRFTSSAKNWHFPPRSLKAYCRRARAWLQFEFCGCSRFTSCYGEPFEASAVMCSRCHWQRVCDSHDLAGNFGVRVHLLQNFVPPPRFFLSSTGVLVTDFFAPLVAVITMCYCYYVVASVVSHYSDEWVSKAVLLQLAHFNFACSLILFFHKNFYAIYIRHKIIKV